MNFISSLSCKEILSFSRWEDRKSDLYSLSVYNFLYSIVILTLLCKVIISVYLLYQDIDVVTITITTITMAVGGSSDELLLHLA